MKNSIIIFFIALGQLCFGQKPDTCLPKTQFYDLRHRMALLAEVNRDQQFQIRLLKELDKVDTVHNSMDSSVVNYLGKTGKIIKTQKRYLKKGCTKDSLVIHYNKDELTEYIENWSSSLYDTDIADKENWSFVYKNFYSRYEYDSLKRVTKHVFHISTPATRRTLISYDREGKHTSKTTAIRDDEFWE